MTWEAYPHLSRDETGMTHVFCPTIGTSLSEAKAGAEFVLNAFATGKAAFIRESPQSETVVDFNGGQTEHKGFVRFSFRDEPGEWHHAPETPQLMAAFAISGK